MSVRIIVGDALAALQALDSESVQVCVTSPPYYGLRDYGVDGQIGLEQTPAEFIARLLAVFEEVKRVLRPDGLCFVNLGDSYAGSGKGASNSMQRPASCLNDRQLEQRAAPTSWIPVGAGLKPKDLCLIPQRFAIAMQDAGWWVRSEIVWAKTSAMPESVKDRPTSAWEPIWMFAKSRTYFYDAEAVAQPSLSTHPSGNGYKRPERLSVNGRGQDEPWQVQPTSALRNVWALGPEPQGAFKWSERVPVSVDDADDDTERTTSPDCPVHASRPASTSRRGGPLDDPLSRNPRNGTGRVQAPLVADAPTEGQSLERPETAPSLGDLAATPHSTPSSKTGQRAETTPPDSASSETIHRTAHTSTQPAVGSLHLGMAESSISMGDLVVHPSPRTGSDTARTPSVRRTSSPCTCSYSKVIIRETSHFAAFPTEIPRRCILAGTSEKGACPACGAPWARVVEQTSPPDLGRGRQSWTAGATATPQRDSNGGLHPVAPKHLGWAPSCQCDAGAPVPQTVLDPFGGSGTTALVADRLGRSSILIELSPVYAEMAQRRLDRDAPMLSEPAHLDTAWQQTDLFAEAVS